MTSVSRSSNFSSYESERLMSLCDLHKDILECKQTGVLSRESKEKAWDAIQENFNLSTESPRTVQQLKNKYQQIKKDTKKAGANYWKDFYKIGLEPASPKVYETDYIKYENELDRSTDLSSTTFVTDYIKEEPQEVIENPTPPFENIDGKNIVTVCPSPGVETTASTSHSSGWGKYRPTLTSLRLTNGKKTKTSERFIEQKKDQEEELFSHKMAVMAKEKELIEKKILQADEEHKIKMEMLNEQIRIQSEEHEIRIEDMMMKRQQERELHQLRLKKLKKELND